MWMNGQEVRDRVYVLVLVFVFVSLRERERESVCVRVCVCVYLFGQVLIEKKRKRAKQGVTDPLQIGARVNGYLNISLMHRPEPSNTVVTSKCTTLYQSSSRYSFDS